MRTSRLPSLLLVTLALGGCPALDIDQPIGLVPEADWNADDVAALARAASCWNQLGVNLVVKPDPPVQQQVVFAFEDSVCTHAAAATTRPNLPVAVYVCPPRYWLDVVSLFTVLTHELGHVLNIRKHGRNSLSIMYGGSEEASYWHSGPLAFTSEDRQLLQEANPGFVLTACPSCTCQDWP